MIEFRYTSGFHGLIQYMQWMLNIALLILSFGLLSIFFAPIFSNSTFGILFIFILSVSTVLYVNFKIIKDFPDNLSSFLYVRLHLRTKMSFSEVKEIAFLFNANWDGTWYPLEEVKRVPKQLRKKFIFDFASTKKSNFINKSQQTKNSDEYPCEQYWEKVKKDWEQKKKEKF